MYKKSALLGLLGYTAGCLIGLIFTLQNEGANIKEALPMILAGGIPGAIATGSTVVYEIEKWSIFRATATHFLITMGVVSLACFVLDWFEPWSASFWIMIGVELAGYIIIWLVCHHSYGKKIRRMNEELKKLKQR